jgi:hypothetical protein
LEPLSTSSRFAADFLFAIFLVATLFFAAFFFAAIFGPSWVARDKTAIGHLMRVIVSMVPPAKMNVRWPKDQPARSHKATYSTADLESAVLAGGGFDRLPLLELMPGEGTRGRRW